MPPIPPFVVEYFLLGKTRRDAIERYTQDGGIVTDVWLAFAKDTEAPQRVLVAPSVGVSAVDLGFALHHAITESRRNSPNQAREPLGVSPLENFVAVTIYFDELVRIVFPLTSWWHRKNLGALQRTAFKSAQKLDEMLERAIRIKLGREEEEMGLRLDAASAEVFPDRRILEAAPLAALIGVFFAARVDPNLWPGALLPGPRPGRRATRSPGGLANRRGATAEGTSRCSSPLNPCRPAKATASSCTGAPPPSRSSPSSMAAPAPSGRRAYCRA
jgi:hypothetical protein